MGVSTPMVTVRKSLSNLSKAMSQIIKTVSMFRAGELCKETRRFSLLVVGVCAARSRRRAGEAPATRAKRAS